MPAHTKPYIVTMVLKAESKQPPHEVCHAQSLRTLAISPYASSQEIETALVQQHQLGCIPEPMLAVIAAALLSVQQRQAYDQQLMALDEVPIPAQAPSLSQAQPEQSYHHANTDDDIVFYDDLHTSSQTQQLHQASQSEQMANNALTDAIGTVLDIISVGF